MTSLPRPELTWKVSSRCNNGSCIAVAPLPDGGIAVRDTKQADGPILSFSRDEWSAFIGQLKRS
ncbi:DUF397 domain-containing protein [Nonomuraea sp. C10]|jgi:hypothetical protein|uniref:DUF397 domain-containing protein n=1 Tax=Nonomuraea sp. C10 TaxID=2600577 RepID=UPI0011CE7F3E|nr:DUF397 domain-containing protein [Nonomuraea sp. C10]TXK43153.1 DUF397 domain-containing protein [Nonomuraea sp. C10]